MRGWRLACVATLFIGAGLVAWRCSRTEAPVLGAVRSYHALDDGTAVVVWSSKHTYVVRVREDGTIVWRREIDAPALGFTVAADREVVVVRNFWDGCGTKDHCDKLIGLAVEDGRILWQRDPAHRPGMPMFSLSPTLVEHRYVDGLAVKSSEDMLFAIDTRTGALRWEHPLRHSDYRVLRLGSRLLFEKLYQVIAYDPETGAQQTAELQGHGCVLDGTYYTITGVEAPALMAFPGGDLGSPREVARVPLPSRRPLLSFVDSCGVYGTRLVFAITTRSNPEAGHTVVLLSIDPSGTVHQLIEVTDTARLGHRFEIAFDGNIPRFVFGWVLAPNEPAQLLSIDLREGKVARRGTTPFRFELFRVGSVWYGNWRGVLLAIDGTDGGVRAVHVGYDEVLATHAANGQLWLFERSQETAIDAIPIAVLDPTTLAPRRARGLVVRDATAIAQQAFGP